MDVAGAHFSWAWADVGGPNKIGPRLAWARCFDLGGEIKLGCQLEFGPGAVKSPFVKISLTFLSFFLLFLLGRLSPLFLLSGPCFPFFPSFLHFFIAERSRGL